jgi:hypothetical protein
MIMSRMRHFTVCALFVSSRFVTPVAAQVAVPTLVTEANTPLSSPSSEATSALEAIYHVGIKQALVRSSGIAVSFRETRYPKDSLMRVASAEGEVWLRRLQRRPVEGIQHDAAAQVGVWANRDEYAKAQIAARLATPGLRLMDRAYTLYTAVTAFSDENYPARLPIAEEYFAQLDALSDSAAYWKIAAHEKLVGAYYMLGRSADVIRHGTRALQQFGSVPYMDRHPMIVYYIYACTVDALSGLPGGRDQIDALDRLLRAPAITAAPQQLLALDSGFAMEGRVRLGYIEQQMIRQSAMLGRLGEPLVSNYWVNRPTTDSAIIPVNDGKIRLLENLSYGCDGCVAALHSLQRIQARFPSTVQVIATTFTFGVWANRFVDPDEEAQRLQNYFVNDLKVTFPIAIWKWPKHPEGGDAYKPDGMWETPNGIHYPEFAKPTTYLIDGNGRIRRIFVGSGRDIEALMLKTVEFLHREAHVQ